MNKFLSRKFIVWLVTAVFAGLAMFMMSGMEQLFMLGIFGLTSISYHFAQGKIDLNTKSFDFVSDSETNKPRIDLQINGESIARDILNKEEEIDFSISSPSLRE